MGEISGITGPSRCHLSEAGLFLSNFSFFSRDYIANMPKKASISSQQSPTPAFKSAVELTNDTLHFDDAIPLSVLELQALFRQFLQQHGFPIQTPRLIPNAKGIPVFTQTEKKQHVWHIQTLPGTPLKTRPNLEQCAKWGIQLAKYHQLSDQFTSKDKIPSCPDTQAFLRNPKLKRSKPQIRALWNNAWEKISLLNEWITPLHISLGEVWPHQTQWIGHEISGVQTHQALLSQRSAMADLMLMSLLWCSDRNGKIDLKRQKKMIHAYDDIRPLTPDETSHQDAILVAVALERWYFYSQLAHNTNPASPQKFYENILRNLLKSDHAATAPHHTASKRPSARS